MMWPSGLKVSPIGEWPTARTRQPRTSQFASTMSSTMETLRRELHYLGAKNVELQVAIPASQFRLDGYPRSTAKAEHPGIILTMDSMHGALSYPCDTFAAWEDNLRAIALALEALRKVDRYGVTKRGEQYRGFLALEATAAPVGFDTYAKALGYLIQLTGFNPQDRDPGSAEDFAAGRRKLVRMAQRVAHPDFGGGTAEFQQVALAEAKLREAGLL